MEDRTCEYCGDIIDLAEDRYVVLSDKDEVAEERWKYTHSDCYRDERTQERLRRGVG